ncbi:MAG: hypothetical protein ACLFVO_24245 [Chloroflexaceae bacterium]
MTTDPAVITGNSAQVRVHLFFGGGERAVSVQVIRNQTDGIWYIDDIACAG